MSDDLPPEDPFREGDPEAAEREARRREREERRRARKERERSEGSRRSLADMVGGAAGRDEPDPPAPESDHPGPPEPPAQPEPAPPDPGPVEPAGRTPEPAEPIEPAEPPHAEDEPLDFDFGSEPEPVQPEPPAQDPPPPAPAPIGRRRKPVPTPKPAAAEAEQQAVPRPWPTAADPVDNGSGDRVVVRRRLLAGGAVLAVLAVIFILVKAVSGGEAEPAPVAAEKPVKTIDVLVPEGLTIDQIAKVAKKEKLKGSYEKAVEQAAKKFPLKRYGAEDATSMEGFLFPATYELEKGASAKDLVDKQLEAFQQNFDMVNTKKAQKKNLSDYDVVTIASLIEKEIQVADERPLAAAVIYNRLKAGETLGLDATLRYELNNFDEQLLQSELDAATPYNTRLTPGLPPTPIANPGLASLEAAANPANSDVFFFVVKPGTCGEHVFTADKAEFDAAEAAYQQALAEEGGSPTDCG